METKPERSSWFAGLVLALLAGQLGLLWVQGRLLHRQHLDLVDLKAEIQYLSESLDAALAEPGADETLAPARAPRLRRRQAMVKASIQSQEEPQDAAAKELQAARESARKAVKDSREVQSKLSIEENARKAEEKAKVKGTWEMGTKAFLIALGAGLLAMAARAWMRRRG